MKNILIMIVVLVLVFVVAATSAQVPNTQYRPVSDKVTAPDANWPTPAELDKGQKALDEMIEQSK